MKSYSLEIFLHDLVAGITVMVVAIPQGMAYAIVADVPPIYGLYTVIVSGIVAAAFGSSRHLSTGPTNTTSVVFALMLAGYHGGLSPSETILLFTFMIGGIKCLLALLRIGKLVPFISDAVIVGFTAGAGILIAVMQLKHCLGVIPHVGAVTTIEILYGTLSKLPELNPWSLGISSFTAIFIMILRKISRKIPGMLLAAVITGALVYFLKLGQAGLMTVGDIGKISRALPPFTPFAFHFGAIQSLAGAAFAVAILGILETTAITRAIATESGQRLNPRREFISQGMANMAGSFFGNYASSASLVRSMINFHSGAVTRMAAVFCGILALFAVLIFGPLAEYIPIASLAGMIMVVAFRMLNPARMRLAWRAGRESALIMTATILATLFVRIDLALFLGILLALISFIRNSRASSITLLISTEPDQYREIPLEGAVEEAIEGETIILNVTGSLYFNTLDDLHEEICSLLDRKPRAVVFRLRRVNYFDTSLCSSIGSYLKEARKRGILFSLSGVSREIYRTLELCGLADKIGPDRISLLKEKLFHSTKKTVRLITDEAESDSTDKE